LLAILIFLFAQERKAYDNGLREWQAKV
jgi:hypothetical protein